MQFERPRSVIAFLICVCAGFLLWTSGLMTASDPKPVLQAASPPPLARIRVYWDPRQEPWSGLNLLNEGEIPLEIRNIILNDRNDCKLRFIHTGEVETAPGSIGRMEFVAYTLFALHSIGFFLDAGSEIGSGQSKPVTMLVGDRAILIKPPQCGAIVRASVDTDRGLFKIQFDKPYTGQK